MEDARPAKRARSNSGAAKKPAQKRAYFGRQPGEVKFFDTATSFTFDATAEVPATGQLVLIPQGVTESTRVGRKCVVKSVQGRWDISYAPGAGASALTTVSLYLIQDKQTNGAAAAAADVFLAGTLSQAMHNLSNADRFVVLKKWNIVLQPMAGATTAYNNVMKHVEFFKKCNIPLEFSSTAGAITELKSNNIFLLAGAYSTDDLVTCAGNVRVRFTDGS